MARASTEKSTSDRLQACVISPRFEGETMKAILLFGLVAACGPGMRGDDFGDDDGSGSGMGSGSGVAGQCDKMDIVFVVDDSGSMSEEQSNLASNFPMFASI